MPKGTIVAIPQAEQVQMLAALRRARYGYLLALHILLLCAAGYYLTEIAVVLFCSRASVYRRVGAYREHALGREHDAQGHLVPPVCTTVRLPTLRRSLIALLKASPRAYGWCHILEMCHADPDAAGQTGIVVSAETMLSMIIEKKFSRALGEM
jgi:hypothetical protein